MVCLLDCPLIVYLANVVIYQLVLVVLARLHVLVNLLVLTLLAGLGVLVLHPLVVVVRLKSRS